MTMQRGKGGQVFIIDKRDDFANVAAWQEPWESSIREPITTSPAGETKKGQVSRYIHLSPFGLSL